MEERQIIKFLDRTLDNMTTITESVAIVRLPGNSDRWWLNTDWLILSVEKNTSVCEQKVCCRKRSKAVVFMKVKMILAADCKRKRLIFVINTIADYLCTEFKVQNTIRANFCKLFSFSCCNTEFCNLPQI